MSADPYDAVQSEVQSALQSAIQLRASYRRIRSTAFGESEELNYTRSELKATLSALEADLDELDESVKIVERAGGRSFGLSETEVLQRRRYIQQVRKEVEGMRGELTSSATQYPPQPGARSYYGEEEDEQAAWSRVEQEMIMREQESTLDSISGALDTIAQQAGLIGQEVEVHNEMLADLERNVDSTDSKLGSAMKRLQKFARDSEEKGSGWCVAILIVILCLLLLAVILV